MAFSQGHALVVGVGTYLHTPKRDVPSTTGDAEAVAAVLRDPQRCGYPSEHVILLTSEQATRAAVLDALDSLAGRVQSTDTVFLFYAGHGDYGEDGAYYLTTHDTELADGKVANQSGVRQDELLQRIKAIPARRMVLVFNACHAGEVAPEALGADEPADRTTEEDTGQSLPADVAGALLSAGEGRIIITACRPEQKSYFLRSAATTIFGQMLVAGLQGKELPARKGTIGVFDLYAYVHDQVNGAVRRRFELSQEPELTVSKGVGVMAVALYPGQAQLGELGVDDRPRERRGRVRELDEQQSRELFAQVVNLRTEFVGRDKIQPGRDYFADPAAVARNVRGNQAAGGRDAAGRDMWKGDEFSVGNITDSTVVLGRNSSANVSHSASGTRTSFNAQTGSAYVGVTLQEATTEVRRAEEQARNAGLGSMARALRTVAETMEDALQAEAGRNTTQRMRFQERAMRDLEELAKEDAWLKPLHELVKQIV